MQVILFDTETTGTDPEVDQIIEAAWLELPPTPGEFHDVPNAKAFPFYHQRFKPSCSIGLGAQAVHHILHQDLAGCPDSKTFKIPKTVDFMVGHKIYFDHLMAGEPKVDLICTLAMSRYLFPDKDSHTQSAMLYLIGRRSAKESRIRDLLRGAHAALDDVRNCSILLRFLLTEAATRGIPVGTWDEVHKLSEIARIPTVMGFGKHKGDAIQDVPSSYVRWYRGQAETDPYYLEAFKRAGF
jgi:exodeoxyribonuclease X